MYSGQAGSKPTHLIHTWSICYLPVYCCTCSMVFGGRCGAAVRTPPGCLCGRILERRSERSGGCHGKMNRKVEVCKCDIQKKAIAVKQRCTTSKGGERRQG